MLFWKKKKKTESLDTEMENSEKDESITEELNSSETGVSDERKISEEILQENEQEESLPVHKADQKRFVRECCESAKENDLQIEEAKKEYEKVTSYLSDIQKIDNIKGDDRKELLDTCKNIINLTHERNKYKNRNLTITESQIRKFEPYEDDLVEEIKKMYNAESYQKAIESDITNLKKEKLDLYKQKQEIIANQNALKGMARVLVALIISLFVLFVVIYYALEIDMTIPYLGTILLAAISSTVIFVEANKNRHDMALNDRKVHKAVTLMNRVKIKYVNNVNILDYNCNKFGVKNAADFEKNWNEYCKMKEYERRFRENTEKLSFNNDALIDILKEHEIKDREIWLGQTVAIVDDREMVEIRHDLNGRRQKLRERIEYNENTKSELIKKIDDLIKKNPEMQSEFIDIVKEYSM